MRGRNLFAGFALYLVGTAQGYALGLGEIELHSALNQPLDAEISLFSVTANEVEDVSVRLADAMAFSAAGVDRTALVTRLNFQVVTNAAGFSVVRVTTTESIREPLLNFIVEVNWPGGRLLREYTLLVDPPLFLSEETAGPVQAPATREPRRVQIQTPPQPDVRVGAVTPASSRTPVAGASGSDRRATAPRGPLSASAAVQATYGPIARNETLWDVAEKTRPSNQVSVEQMMIALYEENPSAFIDDNINNLKAGYVLRIPEPGAVGVINHAQAKREARNHYSRWMAARKTSATVVAGAASTDVRVAAVSEEDAHKAGRAASTAQPASPEPQLGLASPEEGEITAAGGESTKEEELEAVRAELRLALQEAEVTRQERERLANQLVAAEEQLAAMERSLALMERFLDLEDGDLVKLQNMLDLLPNQAGPAEEAGRTRSAFAVELSGENDAAAAPIGLEKAHVAAREEQDWRDLSMTPSTLGVVGAAGLLLGVVGWTVVRRRHLAEGAHATGFGADRAESVDRSITSVEPARKSPVAAQSPLARSAAVAEPDFADNIRSFSALRPKESEVVPVSEVEELIRDALRAKPERRDLRLKLLEILYSLENRQGFEAQAEELHAFLEGEDGTTWSKVREMGAELCPDHPLFSGAEASMDREAGVGEGLNTAMQQSASEPADGVQDELEWKWAEDERLGEASRGQSTMKNDEADLRATTSSELADTEVDLRFHEGGEDETSQSTYSAESLEALQEALREEIDGHSAESEPDAGEETQVVEGPGFRGAGGRSAEGNEGVAEDRLDIDPGTVGSAKTDEETEEVERELTEEADSLITRISDESDSDSVTSPVTQDLERAGKRFR